MSGIQLDIRTILFIVTIIRFAQVFALIHAWYTHKQYPPARDWAVGSLLSSIGVLLIGFRDIVPLWVSVPVANGLLIPGWMIFNFGIARAADRNPPWMAGCLVSVTAVISLYWYSIIEPVFAARLIIFNITELLFDGYAVYCCLAYSRDNRKTTFRIVAALLSLVIVFCALRTLNGLAVRQTSVLAQSATQVWFLVVTIFSSIIATIMMVLLTAQKLQEDIKELIRQREMERDSAQLNAMTDVLTGLPNRRRFDEVLNVEFYRLKRSRAPLSLIMLDVDCFKNFNDSYGHLAGDECLRQLSRTMRNAVTRASDLAARYGGEEIAVVLPETNSHGAETMAERIRKMVEQLAIPHKSSAVAGHVTVSLGVATVETTNLESPDEVVALADKALYLAKQSGRNRVELFPHRTYERDSSRLDFCLLWHEENQCGNSLIDSQHRKLFNDSNRLLNSIIRKSPKNENMELINELIRDVAQHFKDEEALLREIGFPSAEEHGKTHAELMRKAQILLDKFMRNELEVGELFAFITNDVISEHMFSDDRNFFPWIGPN